MFSLSARTFAPLDPNLGGAGVVEWRHGAPIVRSRQPTGMARVLVRRGNVAAE